MIVASSNVFRYAQKLERAPTGAAMLQNNRQLECFLLRLKLERAPTGLGISDWRQIVQFQRRVIR